MSDLLNICMTIGLVMCFQTAASQENAWTVKQLCDHIYELRHDLPGYPVKVIVSAGADGILMVDAGDGERAEELKAQLQELWHGEPKIIILSHEHIEHIDGAEIFGRDPIVIGHPTLRSVLRQRHFLFADYTEATLPDITLDSSLSLFFNGEEIKLISVAGGHSGSDIIVWFTTSEIAFVQALCNWPHFPSIDNTTGNVRRYVEEVGKVIALLPESTKIVSGHGENCSMSEFRQFHDMLIRTSDIVTTGLAQGKTMEQLQQEDALRDFRSYEGSYTSANSWIEYLVEGSQERPQDKRKSIYEEMYHTLKDMGIDAAVARYDALKQGHPDEYKFDDVTPAIIGYMLCKKGKYPEAIGFLKLSLREYPQGPYANLSYQQLGKSYENTNDREQALACYRRLLRIDPSDTTIANKVKELENK